MLCGWGVGGFRKKFPYYNRHLTNLPIGIMVNKVVV